MGEVRWYIVHAYSGFEQKVAQQIMEQAEHQGMTDLIEEVFVPTEEVIEMKRGQKVPSERKFFPGYVLVNMELNDVSYNLIKNLPKVTTLIRPTPTRLTTSRKPIPTKRPTARTKTVRTSPKTPKPTKKIRRLNTKKPS